MSSLAKLSLLQANMNNSIRANVLTSKGIGYMADVSSYLTDISTVIINNSISIADLLISIDKIGDYTYPGRRRLPHAMSQWINSCLIFSNALVTSSILQMQ
jgi:hypothetical protein